MQHSISIVLPVYNEEHGIKSTLKNLVPVLEKSFSDYEIIIVESGSTDKSGEISDESARKNRKIKVIHQGERKGYGNAVREGLKHCRHELSMYIDCDHPYDFKYLQEAAKYMGRYDAVIGYKKGKRESFGRFILSEGGYFFHKVFFNISTKDISYPFKMMKTKFVKKMILVSDHSFIAPEILIELKRQKAKIKEILVPHTKRREGTSKFMNYKKVIIDHIKDLIKYLKKR